jgi:prevent-host-death family protein
MMKTASSVEVESQFSEYLKASETEPILITREGRPIAVIVGIHNEDAIKRLSMTAPRHLQAILEESRRQIRAEDTLTHEDFWQEVARNRTSAM